MCAELTAEWKSTFCNYNFDKKYFKSSYGTQVFEFMKLELTYLGSEDFLEPNSSCKYHSFPCLVWQLGIPRLYEKESSPPFLFMVFLLMKHLRRSLWEALWRFCWMFLNFVFLIGCVTCLDYDEHYILTFPNGYGRQVNILFGIFICLVTHHILDLALRRLYMCTCMFIIAGLFSLCHG